MFKSEELASGSHQLWLQTRASSRVERSHTSLFSTFVYFLLCASSQSSTLHLLPFRPYILASTRFVQCPHQSKLGNLFVGKACSPITRLLRKQAAALPVSARKVELLDSLNQHNVMVPVNPTGSGKTTQLLRSVVEAGLSKRVVVTQIRPSAAQRTVERIAAEMDVKLKETVGLRYRGMHRDGPKTKLLVVTDGLLFIVVKVDIILSANNVIVIGQAHEHSVTPEILLDLLKQILEAKTRPDLKTIIMLVPVNAAASVDRFPGATLKEIEGRSYKINIRYRSWLLPKASSTVLLRWNSWFIHARICLRVSQFANAPMPDGFCAEGLR